MININTLYFYHDLWKKLENRTKGAVIITAMTLNMAMVAYPLFQLFYRNFYEEINTALTGAASVPTNLMGRQINW